MRYVSTRGTAPVLSFEEAMMTGLARDGGLYLPETYPTLSAGEIAAMAGQSYEDIAFAVMRPSPKNCRLIPTQPMYRLSSASGSTPSPITSSVDPPPMSTTSIRWR